MDSPIVASATSASTIGRVNDGVHTDQCDIACQQLHVRVVPACLVPASAAVVRMKRVWATSATRGNR